MRRAAVVLLALAAVPAALSSHGGVRDQYAAWSPDGTSIAFTTNPGGGGQIWQAKLDGTQHRRIVASTATQGVWSPDGRRIAYTSLRAGNWDIYIRALDGGAETRVTTHESPDWAPAWSPDGSRIAFYRFDEADMHGAIWVARADGSEEAVLAAQGNNQVPQWSPDGSRIAFQSFRDGNWEIYVMASDGSAQRRLTATPARHEGEPSWSPDGRIVFSAGDSVGRDIYVINADGSGERRLTVLNLQVWGPRVSPDGSRIAFFEFPPGHIYVADADGSNATRPFARPTITSVRTAPKTPAAGKTYTIIVDVTGAGAGTRLMCRASAGRRLPLAARSFAAGRARCAWRIPVQARGARLFASVTVATENGIATRNVSALVR